MTLSIYRINLAIEDKQWVAEIGRPLSVGADYEGRANRFNLWYETDSENAGLLEMQIIVAGTGHPLPWTRYSRHAYRHLGTVIYLEHPLVWHIFAGPRKGESIGL